MSDENNVIESGVPGGVAAPSVGNQLKAAREAKQMSVGDIAIALKLTSRQVEALENGNWQGLPGQTFIRGFVRNYARLLQLDSAPLMSQLDTVLEVPQQRLSLPGQNRQVAMPQVGRTARRDYLMALSGLLLVAIAVAIYFLLPAGLPDLRSGLESISALLSRKEAAPAAPVPAPEPVFPPGETPQQVMNPQAVVPLPEAANPPASTVALVPPPVQQETVSPAPAAPTLVPVPVQSEVPTSPPVSTSSPVPSTSAVIPSVGSASGDNATLHFSFAQEAWVEVRDRHGKVLISKMGRAGMERSVEGQAPFSLVVGNVSGVKLSLRGQPVDLASHSQGNVARLTLE